MDLNNEENEVSVDYLNFLVSQIDVMNPKPEALQELQEFKERSDAYTYVIPILISDSFWKTKFVALTILKDFVQKNWDDIEQDYQNLIKQIIIQKIGEFVINKENPQLIGEANSCLVCILSEDWPDGWEDFVPNILELIAENIQLFTNYLNVMSMLGEDIHKRALSKVSSIKIQRLSNAMPLVFTSFAPLIKDVNQDCDFEYVKAVFGFIEALIPFITPAQFVETTLSETCLTGLSLFPVFHQQIYNVFACIMESNVWEEGPQQAPIIFQVIQDSVMDQYGDPPTFGPKPAEAEQLVLSIIHFFLSTTVKYRIYLESQIPDRFVHMLIIFVGFIQEFPSDEVKMACYEIFLSILSDLYKEKEKQEISSYGIYQEPFSQLLENIVNTLDAPYSIITSDDGINGRRVLEMDESDSLFNAMRSCLVFMTNLIPESVFDPISNLFEMIKQRAASPQLISSFCSSVGAIANIIPQEADSGLMLDIIETILQILSSVTEEEIIITLSQGVLYLFTQCQRLLNSNYDLFVQIIQMIFSYMHSTTDPDTKALSVHSFTVLARTCQQQFIDPRSGNVYIEQILNDIDSILPELDNACTITFFGSLARIIKSVKMPEVNKKLLDMLVSPLGNNFVDYCSNIGNPDEEIASTFIFYLRCFSSLFSGAGIESQPYIEEIFNYIINIYNFYGELNYTTNGEKEYPSIVMKSAINCIESFAIALNSEMATTQSLMESCLDNFVETYVNSEPNQRVSIIVEMFGVLIAAGGKKLTPEMYNFLFQNIYLPTCDMITNDQDSYIPFRKAIIIFLRSTAIGNLTYIASLEDEQRQQIFGIINFLANSPYYEISIEAIKLYPIFAKSKSIEDASLEIKERYYNEFLPSSTMYLFDLLSDTMHRNIYDELSSILQEVLNTPWMMMHANLLTQQFLEKDPDQTEEFFNQFVTQLLSHINDAKQFKIVLNDFLISLEKLNVLDPIFLENQKIAIQKRNKENIKNVKGMRKAKISEKDNKAAVDAVSLLINWLTL